MRRKMLHHAKLVITVEGTKRGKITTLSVYDNRTQAYWTQDRIRERGITWFLDLADMKETLNWNLNGNAQKFQFKWVQSGKTTSQGISYVFH